MKNVKSYNGYPDIYDNGFVEGAKQPNLFEPALKHYGRAFRLGDPAFEDAAVAERWYAARTRVMRHLVQLTMTSPWAASLVLRGSLLLKAWLGDQAREPGDIDWVVIPPSMHSKSPEALRMMEGLIQRYTADSEIGDVIIQSRGIAWDDIWTYERAPGVRIVLPWSAAGIPPGSVQMDLVFEEELLTQPVLTALPSAEGGTSVLGVDRSLALAWKLLWLETDSYPQGKDLYDATLLAEQTSLPVALLQRVMTKADPRWKAPAPGLLGVDWVMEWDDFAQEYPWVEGDAEDWIARLNNALAPTLTEQR